MSEDMKSFISDNKQTILKIIDMIFAIIKGLFESGEISLSF